MRYEYSTFAVIDDKYVNVKLLTGFCHNQHLLTYVIYC